MNGGGGGSVKVNQVVLEYEGECGKVTLLGKC